MPVLPRRRSNVDLLYVTAGTTPGLRRAEASLASALRNLGIGVVEVRSDYRLTRRVWHRINHSLLLIDLFESAALRRALGRALRLWRPRAILYGTTHAAMLQPSRRTRGAAIMFDSPAAFNRPGRRYTFEHWRERGVFRRAGLLVPWGVEPADEVTRAFPAAAPVVPVPVPLDGEGSAADGVREPLAVAYAGNPPKKGLDVIAEAWRWAAPSGWRLVVTGIDRDRALRYLSDLGIEEPGGIEWAGEIAPADFRALVSRAELYLAAPRFEDFGLAQLEALLDGALLVTLPAPGRYEALKLARSLDPRLVAADMSATALAAALRAGSRLTPEERLTYRRKARALAGRYSAEELRNRLARDVLPALLGSRSAAAPGTKMPSA
jgi:hypothetical protein